MRKTLLTLLCLAATALMLLGQAPQDSLSEKAQRKLERKTRKAESQRYLVFSYGLGYNQTRDPKMADFNYFGPGAIISFGYWQVAKKGLWDVTFASGRYDYLTPDNGESFVHNPRYDGEMWYLRDLKTYADGKLKWRLGGYFGLTYNFRYNPFLSNSSVHWDGIGSLGISSSLTQDLHFFNADWKLHYKLALPLLSYLNRLPDYRLSGFTGPRSYVAAIGQYTRVVSEISLSKRLGPHTSNRFKVSYRWDFYAFNESDIHRLRVANHSLTFALLFKL